MRLEHLLSGEKRYSAQLDRSFGAGQVSKEHLLSGATAYRFEKYSVRPIHFPSCFIPPTADSASSVDFFAAPVGLFYDIGDEMVRSLFVETPPPRLTATKSYSSVG